MNTPPNASLPVVFGFASLAIVVASLVAGAVAFASIRDGASRATTARRIGVTAGALATWMATFYVLADRGAFARFDARPPPVIAIFVATVAGAVGLARCPIGSLMARRVPLAALVAAQAFRLPLELVMHAAAREGVMPEQMSFSGLNFDILTGAGAIAVAGSYAYGLVGRRTIALWNAVGAALLATIVAIAIASTPLFHAFGTDPARVNTFVAYPPFIWLPTVLVAGALAGHLLVARALAMASDGSGK